MKIRMCHMTSLALATALFAGAAGCTWGGLDDLSKKTPVRVYEKPKDFTSPGFGQYMVVLERTNEDSTLR